MKVNYIYHFLNCFSKGCFFSLKKCWNMNKKITCLMFSLMLLSFSFSTIGGVKLSGHRSVNHENHENVNWWPMFKHDNSGSSYSPSDAPGKPNKLWVKNFDDINGGNLYSPVIAGYKIFLGVWNQGIYCLNSSNGSLNWYYPTDFVVCFSPAVKNDRLYVVGSKNWMGKVFCIDTKEGGLFWEKRINRSIKTSILLYNEKTYFGAGSYLYCLNGNTGDVLWVFKTDSDVESTPMSYDGRIYFGSNDFNIYCLNAENGGLIWKYKTAGEIKSSPTIFNSRIYIGSFDNKVYCLDAYSGEKKWEFSTGDDVLSSPAAAYEKIYVGSFDTFLYCLPYKDPDQSGLIEPDELIWKCQPGKGYSDAVGSITVTPAVADGKIYIGDVPSCSSTFACLNAENGRVIWRKTLSLLSSPVIADNCLFICSRSSGGGLKIHVFKHINSPPSTPRCPTGKMLVTSDKNYTYYAKTFDSDNDKIFYRFNWGDGTQSDWLGPFNPGVICVCDHSWKNSFLCLLKVKAKDEQGAESSWSTPLLVINIGYLFHISF